VTRDVLGSENGLFGGIRSQAGAIRMLQSSIFLRGVVFCAASLAPPVRMPGGCYQP